MQHSQQGHPVSVREGIGACTPIADWLRVTDHHVDQLFDRANDNDRELAKAGRRMEPT